MGGGAFINGQSNSTVTVTGQNSFIGSFGLTNNGTINIGDGAAFNATGGAFTNLSTKADGTVVLDGGTYNLAGSLFVDTPGNAGIQAIGANTTVALDGNGGIFLSCGCNALDGLNDIAGTLSVGSSGANGGVGLQAFTPVGGTLTVEEGGALNLGGGLFGVGVVLVDGNLVNNGTINVQGLADLNLGAGSMATGSELAVFGMLTNGDNGTLNLIGANQFVGSLGLYNTGTINIGAGSTLDASTGGTDTFLNLDSSGTLDHGTWNIAGTLNFDPSSSANGGNIPPHPDRAPASR